MKRAEKKPSKQELERMSWDEMDKAGVLSYCKSSHPNLFAEKYYGKFLKWPQGTKEKSMPTTNLSKKPVDVALSDEQIVNNQRLFAVSQEKGWDALEKEEGKLLALKKSNYDIYAALYKERFGDFPNEKPRPFLV